MNPISPEALKAYLERGIRMISRQLEGNLMQPIRLCLEGNRQAYGIILDKLEEGVFDIEDSLPPATDPDTWCATCHASFNENGECQCDRDRHVAS